MLRTRSVAPFAIVTLGVLAAVPARAQYTDPPARYQMPRPSPTNESPWFKFCNSVPKKCGGRCIGADMDPSTGRQYYRYICADGGVRSVPVESITGQAPIKQSF